MITNEKVECNNCSSYYRICEDCGSIIHEDAAYYSNGYEYCQSCYDDLDSCYIEEYGYKPEPNFLGESDEGLYLGVELEVDDGCNLKATTKRLYDDFSNIYLKHDGSLSNSGFEIVSHPAMLEYHMSELGWKEIMDICLENEYRSHDCNTCGLHIHLSRDFLGKDEIEQDLNIAKLIILFDRFWESHIILFSRRKIESIERWADKPSVDCMNTGTETEVMDKVKKNKSLGRYKAINLHFRISTHGGINPALCHPFPISNKIPVLRLLHASTKLAIVHNGVIPIKTRKGISDTMEYIATKINKRYKRQADFYKDKKQRKAIFTEIGNSKMAFLDCKGNIYTLGEFVTDNGIMYSNSSYKEREFSFSFWDDYVDYIKVTPLDDGYIIKSPDILECKYGNYFIDKFGKLYEYDYYFDVAVEIKGTAFNVNGLYVSYNADNSIWINVLK